MAEAALAIPSAAGSPTAAAVPAVSPTATMPASAPAPAPQAQAPAAVPAEPKPLANLLGDEGPKEGEAKAETKAETPPELKAYEALKVPEGITVDEAVLGEFKQIAAEAKMAPEAAQKLVDLQAKLMKQASDGIYGEWNKTQEKWQAEVLADKEIGGDKWPDAKKTIETGLRTMLVNGSTSPEAQAAADKAYNDFMGALKYTGGANNPAIIRALHMLTRPHSEGGPVTGEPSKTAGKTLAERIYGSTA